jgi:hypothetical protein
MKVNDMVFDMVFDKNDGFLDRLLLITTFLEIFIFLREFWLGV